MRKFLKQFEGWVTDLGRSALKRSLLNPFFYVLIPTTGAFAVIAVTVTLYYYHLLEIKNELLKYYLAGGPVPKEVVSDIIDQISKWANVVLLVNLGTIVLVAILGFLILGKVLNNIKRILSQQKRFIADASHELLTPLSIIKTNSEVALIDEDNLTIKEVVSVMKNNIEEIDRMAKIIKRLTLISSVASSEEVLTFTKVELGKIVHEVAKAFKSLAERKSVNLILEKSQKGTMWGNATGLEEVTTNLIKNAIAYTPAGGEIKISVMDNNPKNVELCVKD